MKVFLIIWGMLMLAFGIAAMVMIDLPETASVVEHIIFGGVNGMAIGGGAGQLWIALKR